MTGLPMYRSWGKDQRALDPSGISIAQAAASLFQGIPTVLLRTRTGHNNSPCSVVHQRVRSRFACKTKGSGLAVGSSRCTGYLLQHSGMHFSPCTFKLVANSTLEWSCCTFAVEVAAEMEIETTKESTFFRMEMEVTQLHRPRIS